MAHTRRTFELAQTGTFWPDMRSVVHFRILENVRASIPDTKMWDATLDSSGRIKLAGGDYATAQNVANEARLFTLDAYFIQDQGIPHFVAELGKKFIANEAILRAYLRRAARKVADVNEVLSIEVSRFDPATRELSGVIEFTTVEGKANGSLKTYF
jgi:hypothetical protein